MTKTNHELYSSSFAESFKHILGLIVRSGDAEEDAGRISPSRVVVPHFTVEGHFLFAFLLTTLNIYAHSEVQK